MPAGNDYSAAVPLETVVEEQSTEVITTAQQSNPTETVLLPPVPDGDTEIERLPFRAALVMKHSF